MPTSGADARRRALTNHRLPCSVGGCTHRRKMVSAYCSTHGRRVALFGHHAGRYIRKHEYASYAKLARKLFKRLAHHPAVTAALDTMRAVMTPGEEPQGPKPLRLNPRWLLWRELGRVDEVEPRHALAVVVGVWLLAYHQPRQLPDDERLTYALANAVLRLRPLAVVRSYYDYETDTVDNVHRPPGGLAVGLLGRRIREQLAPFLANVVALLEKEHRENAERAMALRQPLTTTTV